MPARSLVLGLDGADFDVVRSFGPETLPVLFGLMERGAFAHLESVQPPATLPNWTTFLTGVDPGRHGVFDFTSRKGYRVAFTGGTIREAPTVLARLDKLGLRCACLSFPATYPPERFANGIFMSGWDAPVAFEADSSFVWPPALYDSIQDRFGTPRFDDVDEFDADAPGWHDALPGALVARIDRKVELARWLLARESWDVFALYFGESDTAAHHLWSLHDAGSPRSPIRPSDRRGFERVYRRLDRAVGELLEAAGGEQVELTVVSDHGSGGSSDKVLYLNRALAEAGLTSLRTGGSLVAKAKDMALTLLPPKLRERVFDLGGAALPGLVESKARFGSIDMLGSRVFSEELNYFPSVCLNVRGREPQGIVAPNEVPAVRRRVRAALLALRDPWTGAPVVRHVWPREELFRGPFVERAPDLLLELHLDRGYSYNLMPTASAPPGTGPWRRLAPSEHRGRKGRSLVGSHRARGLYVAAGPRVAAVGEIEARIADATATLLCRLDVAVPPEAAGRVLFEALADYGGDSKDLPPVERRQAMEPGDEARVEARLRALGYVD